jgi:hypothetical protein
VATPYAHAPCALGSGLHRAQALAVAELPVWSSEEVEALAVAVAGLCREVGAVSWAVALGVILVDTPTIQVGGWLGGGRGSVGAARTVLRGGRAGGRVAWGCGGGEARRGGCGCGGARADGARADGARADGEGQGASCSRRRRMRVPQRGCARGPAPQAFQEQQPAVWAEFVTLLHADASFAYLWDIVSVLGGGGAAPVVSRRSLEHGGGPGHVLLAVREQLDEAGEGEGGEDLLVTFGVSGGGSEVGGVVLEGRGGPEARGVAGLGGS